MKMNWKSRFVFCAVVEFAIIFAAECHLNIGTIKREPFNDNNNFVVFSLDSVTNILYIQAQEKLALTFTNLSAEEPQPTDFNQKGLRVPCFVYDNRVFCPDKEATKDSICVGSLNVGGDLSCSNFGSSPVLYRTMHIHGVKQNTIVQIYQNSVSFVTINGDSLQKTGTQTFTHSFSTDSSFYDVYQGVVVKDNDSYFFLNITDENVSCEQLSGIDLSSDVFTFDKKGRLYVAEKSVIVMYDLPSKTCIGRNLAKGSSDVNYLKYDEIYDDIYVAGFFGSSATVYRAPAGDRFTLEFTESVLLGDGVGNVSSFYPTSLFTFATTLEGVDAGWHVSLEIQNCDGLDVNNFTKDLQHCRFSLKENKAKILPFCKTGDMCVTSLPQIENVSPKSGSTEGGTLVTVSFKEDFPEDKTISVKFNNKPVNNVQVGSNEISFLTPDRTSAGQVTFSVSIGSFKVTDTFTYYSCVANSCFDCLDANKPECVFDVASGSCCSVINAKDKNSLAYTTCPAFTRVEPTLVTDKSVIKAEVNIYFSNRGWKPHCIFTGSEGTYSVTLPKPEGGVLSCALPGGIPAGIYSFSVGVVSADQKTYYTLNDEEVSITVTVCSEHGDCDSCTEADGCSWCYTSEDFKCKEQSECHVSPNYTDQCPFIGNMLYVDANSLPAGAETYDAEIILKNAGLNTQQCSSLECQVGDVLVEPNCSYNSPNDINCTCRLNLTRGEENEFSVALKYAAATLVSGTLYSITCDYQTYSDCISNPSGACAFDLDTKQCYPLPSNHSAASWVTETPEIVSVPGYVDITNQTVQIQFTSMPNSTSICFECNLKRADSVLKTVPMILGNETMASCNFGDISNISSVSQPELGGTISDLSMTISIANAGNARDSVIDEIFKTVTDTVVPLTFVYCGADRDDLDCSSCRNVKSAQCMWSKKYATCTAAPDDTTSKQTCPTITSISPKSAVLKEGDTIKLRGTHFVENLQVRFTAVDDKKNVINGKLKLLDETIVSYTLKNDMDPAEYNVSVLALSGRPFADTQDMTLEVTEEPVSLMLILYIAAPIVVLLLIAIVIAIVLIKKRGLHPFKFDVNKKPDFSHFSYATDIWTSKNGAAFPSDDRARSELLALLQNPQVCAALCKATSSTEADKFTGAMVYVNATNGHCIDLLMSLVDQEVESVPNTTQLFRGNSLATKAFRAYSRMVGLNYLWMTLSRFMHELNHLSIRKNGKKENHAQQDAEADGVSILSTEFEVDPSKLAEGADEESQSYMLSQRARQLVLCIINSTPNLPPELHSFAIKLRSRVTQRFDDADHIAIGGTFFLRFICPAVIAPHSYGLLLTEDRKKPIVPNDSLQRQLVLLGKVLQNLANGVLFGKKEPFMIGMNDFISSNLPAINDWMDSVSTGEFSFSEKATPVPSKVVSDSYSFLASHIRTNINKIRSALEAQNAPADLAERLESAVGN